MNDNGQHRTVIFYKNYFQEFFEQQRDKVKDKIIWTLRLLEDLPRILKLILNISKAQMDFMKSASRLAVTYFAFFAFLIMGKWLFWLMAFRKKIRRLREVRLKKQ